MNVHNTNEFCFSLGKEAMRSNACIITQVDVNECAQLMHLVCLNDYDIALLANGSCNGCIRCA